MVFLTNLLSSFDSTSSDDLFELLNSSSLASFKDKLFSINLLINCKCIDGLHFNTTFKILVFFTYFLIVSFTLFRKNLLKLLYHQ